MSAAFTVRSLELAQLTTGPIRILLLDHQILVRTGLEFILASQPDMEVVGGAGNPDEGLDLAACQKPDIILLELNPQAGLGLELIPALINACPQTRVILATGSEDPEVYLQAVQNGVLGVVLKTQPPDILFKAIRKVVAGEAWLDHTMIANLLANIVLGRLSSSKDPASERIAHLSGRERQVIQLIGRGLKNQKIAHHLCIGETTVRHHLTSIYSKLEVSDRLELLVFAQRCGLICNPA